MKVGGTRKLTIPRRPRVRMPRPGGGIPPNAALKFDIELLAVK